MPDSPDINSNEEKKNDLTNLIKAAETGINQAIIIIKENYNETLPYHNTDHTNTVIKRTEQILQILRKSGLIISEKDITLAKLAAAYHDVEQRFKIVECQVETERGIINTTKRQRAMGKNEEESANKAEEFMRRYPDLFTQNDIDRVRQAILATTPGFTSENEVFQQTLHEKINNNETIEPILLALCLADLGGAGMEPADRFVSESLRVFLEEYPEIEQIFKSENPDEEEKGKLLAS